jgi:hypothetical protein
MGSCFKMGHVSKLVHDCSWLGHVSKSCVKTGSRLFVVVHVSKLVHDCSWLVHVSKLVHDCSWLVHVSKLVHDCSWFKSIRLAILTPKTLKKMRLVPFYVYIYTVCRLVRVVYILVKFFKFNVLLIDCELQNNKDITTHVVKYAISSFVAT